VPSPSRDTDATSIRPTVAKSLHNIAFTAFLQLGDVASCVDLLVATDRIPEAAMFARTYAPSLVPAVVEKWQTELVSEGKKKVAKAIINPAEDAGAFDEDWAALLELEKNGAPSNSHAEAPVEEDEDEEPVVVENEEDGESDEPERAASPAKVKAAVEDQVPVLAPVVDKVEQLVDGVKELAVGGGKASESTSQSHAPPSSG
jgi:coatomer subunit beta'